MIESDHLRFHCLANGCFVSQIFVVCFMFSTDSYELCIIKKYYTKKLSGIRDSSLPTQRKNWSDWYTSIFV